MKTSKTEIFESKQLKFSNNFIPEAHTFAPKWSIRQERKNIPPETRHTWKENVGRGLLELDLRTPITWSRNGESALRPCEISRRVGWNSSGVNRSIRDSSLCIFLSSQLDHLAPIGQNKGTLFKRLFQTEHNLKDYFKGYLTLKCSYCPLQPCIFVFTSTFCILIFD